VLSKGGNVNPASDVLATLVVASPSMPELSSAAQAVLDAFTEDNSLHAWKHNHHNVDALAAALRAAADQVVPQALCVYNPESISIRSQLLVIANKLEAQ
jgi:hypothetical protein